VLVLARSVSNGSDGAISVSRCVKRSAKAVQISIYSKKIAASWDPATIYKIIDSAGHIDLAGQMNYY
jgi:hypothetical protein